MLLLDNQHLFNNQHLNQHMKDVLVPNTLELPLQKLNNSGLNENLVQKL